MLFIYSVVELVEKFSVSSGTVVLTLLRAAYSSLVEEFNGCSKFIEGSIVCFGSLSSSTLSDLCSELLPVFFACLDLTIASCVFSVVTYPRVFAVLEPCFELFEMFPWCSDLSMSLAWCSECRSECCFKSLVA